MAQPILVAKAALFNEKDEILLIKRSGTADTRPGKLDLPGGGVDEGENYEAAVLREIKEEIGADMTSSGVELVYISTNFYEGNSTLRFLYIGKIPAGQPIKLSYEHDAYYWLPLVEAMEQFDHPVWVGGLQYLQENNLL